MLNRPFFLPLAFTLLALTTITVNAADTSVTTQTEQALLQTTQQKLAHIKQLTDDNQLVQAQTLLNALLSDIDVLNKNEQIDIHLAQANIFDEQNIYIDAITQIKTYVLPLLEATDYKRAGIYQNLAQYLRKDFKLAEAKLYLEKAISLYQKQKNDYKLAEAYSSMGVLYSADHDLSLALSFQLKAKVIFDKIGTLSDKANITFNIGEIYVQLKKLDEALPYVKKALELDTELGDEINVTYDHYLLAQIYFANGQHEIALNHNQIAEDILVRHNKYQLLSRSLLQRDYFFENLNRHDERLAILKRSETEALKSKSQMQLHAVHTHFGNFYTVLSNPLLAEKHFLHALTIAQNLGLDLYERVLHEKLADLYTDLSAFEKAHQHLVKVLELERKIKSELEVKEAEKYKYDIDLLEEQLKVKDLSAIKAKQEMDLANAQIKKQQITILAILLSVFFLALCIYFYQRKQLAATKAKLYLKTSKQKDRLLADVSHELRTPLASLKLQVDKLRHNMTSDVDRTYKKLDKKVSDIDRLITDIYELAKADTGCLSLNITATNAHEFFKPISNDLQTSVEQNGFDYKANITVSKSCVIDIDTAKIAQVIDNLAANSFAYTDKPGQIHFSVIQEKSYLIISLADSAPTVKKEELAKIFERLYRVEKSRSRQTGGSGLGLAICQKLIDTHKGTIVASQNTLGGITMTIRLPILAQ